MTDIVTVTDVIEKLTAEKLAAVADARKARAKAERVGEQASYFRSECQRLAVRGNAAAAIEETLTRRLAAHRRDSMPGDRIAAAALIECQAVLDIVQNTLRGPA